MQVLINRLRRIAARLVPRRAVLMAMLSGPLVGAMLAYGAVAAQDAANVVTIDNFTFGPKELTVAVGTTVTWTNHDDIPHNVVSPEQKFKSPVLDTDEMFSHKFDAAGTYKYYCSIHPRMTGQVVVR